MSTIMAQLKQLRKQIHIPFRIEFVDYEIPPEQFKQKVIYIHIRI